MVSLLNLVKYSFEGKNHFHVLLGVVLWWKSVQVVCEFACWLVWENKYIKMKLRDVRFLFHLNLGFLTLGGVTCSKFVEISAAFIASISIEWNTNLLHEEKYNLKLYFYHYCVALVNKLLFSWWQRRDEKKLFSYYELFSSSFGFGFAAT